MVEVACGTGLRMVVNTGLNMVVLPLFGFAVGIADAAAMTAVFTVSSLVLGYGVRRLFEGAGR